MAQHDKDTPRVPNGGNNIDKPKGQMSIRDAAAMEMPTQHLETGMPASTVHGFGDGQTDTVKRHMSTSTADMGMQQRSTGESVTEIVELISQLPFHAQVGVMRMIAPRILGAMDARDRESFMTMLRSELSAEGSEASPMNMQDFQGT